MSQGAVSQAGLFLSRKPTSKGKFHQLSCQLSVSNIVNDIDSKLSSMHLLIIYTKRTLVSESVLVVSFSV
ncbi:hypothetical protein MH1LPH_23000 [Lactiplantibacillus brownii]